MSIQLTEPIHIIYDTDGYHIYISTEFLSLYSTLLLRTFLEFNIEVDDESLGQFWGAAESHNSDDYEGYRSLFVEDMSENDILFIKALNAFATTLLLAKKDVHTITEPTLIL